MFLNITIKNFWEALIWIFVLCLAKLIITIKKSVSLLVIMDFFINLFHLFKSYLSHNADKFIKINYQTERANFYVYNSCFQSDSIFEKCVDHQQTTLSI